MSLVVPARASEEFCALARVFVPVEAVSARVGVLMNFPFL